ncbi:MAG TPA: LptE family protein [Candidatus Manganitrophaceae bacterium]|nr:LptE family protein [Candidatus Manganitrophaceae bacterium]
MRNGFFLLLFLLAGCGYHRGIRADALPHRPIAIPVFENGTFEPLVEKRVHEIFKETFMTRGWNVVAEDGQAPLVLSGKINRFDRTPVSLNLSGQAQEYRLKIGLAFSLREKGGNPAAESTAEGSAEYIARSDAGEDRAAQDRAIREAGRRLAEQVADLLSQQRMNRLPQTEPAAR